METGINEDTSVMVEKKEDGFRIVNVDEYGYPTKMNEAYNSINLALLDCYEKIPLNGFINMKGLEITKTMNQIRFDVKGLIMHPITIIANSKEIWLSTKANLNIDSVAILIYGLNHILRKDKKTDIDNDYPDYITKHLNIK